MDKRMQLLTRMAAAFPRDHVPQSTIVVYASEIADLEVETLEAVIEDMLKHASAFPTIAEIREAYRHRRIRDAAEGTPALPLGREPMPENVRAEWDGLRGRMDERAEEMEVEEAEGAS